MADRRTDPRHGTSVADNKPSSASGPIEPDPMMRASSGPAGDVRADAAATLSATAPPPPPSNGENLTPEPDRPGRGGGSLHEARGRAGDRVFAYLTTGASGFVVLVVVLIALFLVLKAVPSIVDDKASFLTST